MRLVFVGIGMIYNTTLRSEVLNLTLNDLAQLNSSNRYVNKDITKADSFWLRPYTALSSARLNPPLTDELEKEPEHFEIDLLKIFFTLFNP